MITSFSTDLQYYDSTGEVPGKSIDPVMVTSTVPVLNVGILAEYRSGVLTQYRRSTATVLHLLMLLYIFVINIFVLIYFFSNIFFPEFFFQNISKYFLTLRSHTGYNLAIDQLLV